MSARDDYPRLDSVSGGWARTDIQQALDEIDALRADCTAHLDRIDWLEREVSRLLLRKQP